MSKDLFHFFDNKESFKIHGKSSDLIDSPSKGLLLAGILLLSVISFHISGSFFGTPTTRQQTVLGESVSSQSSFGNSIKIYQVSIKSLMSDYLGHRSIYEQAFELGDLSDTEQRAWLQITQNVQQEVLGIVVPRQYQDFHLRFVILLNSEIGVLDGTSLNSQTLNENTKNLEILLDENIWLNE